ncbi:MAG: hypothetical protein MJZ93_05100 [Paludibacteraceae bacterium]|nr:hypothetical protein [Paludibacteraceae bacterium]
MRAEAKLVLIMPNAAYGQDTILTIVQMRAEAKLVLIMPNAAYGQDTILTIVQMRAEAKRKIRREITHNGA